MANNCYSIKKNRIAKGLYPGFLLNGDKKLVTMPEDVEHFLYLRGIDSGVQGSEWGRLSFQAEFAENMVCNVYVAALDEDSFYRNGEVMRIDDFLCNEEESTIVKKQFLEQIRSERYVNHKDILLYQQKGRYLYFVIELIGAGEATISNLQVNQQGDNFMNTFPEIYRERDSFFHRYLSIFSSIYNDFQLQIDEIDKLLDLDTCPDSLLPVYARWLGIDISDEFQKESWLRMLVKEAYQLNRMKGTKWVIERLAQIVLGENVLVLEQNSMKNFVSEEDYKQFEQLYGSSPYDVSVLIYSEISDELKSKLMFLIDQYKPIRSKIHYVYLKENGLLDGHSYLDMNARTMKQEIGILDERKSLDDIIVLE